MHIGLVTRSQVDYAIDLANNLNAEGIATTLYLEHAHTVGEVGNTEDPVNRLYELGLISPKCAVKLLKPPRMRDPRSLFFFLNLRQIMKDDRVDVVHILLNPGEIWFSLLACILSDFPVVTTIIVPAANIGEHLPGVVIWATNRLAITGSDMIIVNGATQVDWLKQHYAIPADRIKYVQLSMHTRAVQWRQVQQQEEPGTVLFFGRAVTHKGLEYLVRAQPLITKRVPYARFLISAHGEDLERCKAMIDDPDKFEFIEDFVPGDVMATIFQRSSLVALPYLTASTSGVLVTAFSFSKPVVVSRVGCLAEYVDEGVTGLLVPPGNVEALADAIIRLLIDHELRHRMGINAENWIKKVEVEIVKKTLGIYKESIVQHNS